MLRVGALGLVVAGLVACGPSYSKLDVDNINSLTVTAADRRPEFCAYRPVALRAIVTYQDGKEAVSRAAGEKQRGRLRVQEFEWSASHGELDDAAVLLLMGNPLDWFDEPLIVTARVLARPEMTGNGTLHPRFDCGGTLDIRGAAGARGGEAEDGGPGESGPTVHVAIAYVRSQRADRLVLVRVQRGDAEPEYVVIDGRRPEAALGIDARGGAGGRGGQGVAGMAGANGLDGRDGAAPADGLACDEVSAGEPGTDGEAGGPGGPGRNGGRGGDGGTAIVSYDRRFPELASLVRVIVVGGEAGAAGPGGAGGRGGKGGRGGTSPVTNCDGTGGTDGASGAAGPPGEAGTPGPEGSVTERADDVTALFAAEIERGVPIVTDGGAAP